MDKVFDPRQRSQNSDIVLANPAAVELTEVMSKNSSNGELKTGTEDTNRPVTKRARKRSSRRRREGLLKSLLVGTEGTIQEDPEDEDSMDIWEAARAGKTDSIRYLLLDKHNLLNKTDANGVTALHYAVRYNYEDAVEELLNQGADPSARIRDYLYTPLHIGAKGNHTTTVKFLLKFGADINARDDKGMVPLHVAARRGQQEATEVLTVARGASVNVRDYDGMTPLHHAACTHGNVNLCNFLIENGADIRCKEINDITPLMFAAIRGNMEIMKLILEVGRDMDISPGLLMADVDDEGSNALHLAVARGHLQAAKLCLESGADIESSKHNGFTPLHIAAVSGNYIMTALLLENGSKVNAKDDEHMTPLHRASMYSRVDIMKLLVMESAILESQDLEFFTPLLAAAWKGQTRAAKYLIQQGANITVIDRDMKTCMHWAVEGNHYEFAKMLLSNGGERLLNEKDKKEQTVVHYAAKSGNSKILSLLITSNAEVDGKDFDERIPLHIAASCGRLECVRLLAEACPTKINDDDVDGRTPLLLAAEEGYDKVVRQLLKNGADISSKDENRRTPLALAATEGHRDTVKVLVENHAEIDVFDKNKNTPLHLSAANGHVAVTLLLLDEGATPTLTNDSEQNPLDAATFTLEEETAAAIVRHRTWKEVINQPTVEGYPPMKRLIERLPDVALVVLDQCVTFSHSDKANPNLKITYDYYHINPGPDDERVMKTDKQWCALTTMVEFSRENLLMHELCKTLLAIKWKRFARYFFTFDFCMYLVFLAAIMTYMLSSPRPVGERLDSHGCPIPPGTNQSDIIDGNLHFTVGTERKFLIAIESYVFLYCVANVIREIVEIIKLRLQYFSEISNYVDWGLYTTAVFFVLPPGNQPCTYQWQGGAMAAFFGWMNLIMYVRRFAMFGIYIEMFFQVIKSFMKAIMVFILFVLAFSSSFFMLLGRIEAFSDFGGSFVKVCVMTVGEMDYTDIFYGDTSLKPFEESAMVLFTIFLFLMPIMLMNLMVGIAVGDIEFIQQNANVEKMELQIGLVRSIEQSLPKVLQRRWHVDKMVVEPYKRRIMKRIKNQFSRRNEEAKIAAKEEAKLKQEENDQDQLRKEIDEMNTRMTSSHKMLMTMMDRQTDLVRKIAEKMDVPYDEADFLTHDKTVIT
ncbi:transient receptor potential cation channel subfamily A member 1-like isoform X2 [Glandiceps talaboti]